MADQSANNAPHSQSSNSFLDRLKGFFGFDNDVDPDELRNSKDIEIHSWNGPNDPENPYVVILSVRMVAFVLTDPS